MRKALVDNATLTAVQRLNGKNKYALDGDILAMESLLQAILFFDEVYYLDDYKAEFQESRSQYFSWMTPIVLDEESRKAFSKETLEQVQSVVPKVAAGSFADGDFKPFFDMLKMHLWYVWNIQSSVFYLTQKLLADASHTDIKKYSALSSMIYSELKDATGQNEIPKRKPVLLGSDGQPISPDENVPRQVTTFFAGLNWLAYRTVYYTLLANQLHLDLFLHPIRQAFQANYFRKHYGTSTFHYRPLIDALTKTTTDTMERVYQAVNPHISASPIPIFSAYIAEKGQRAGLSALEMAYHMRQEGMFVQARSQLETLEQLYAAGRGKKFLQEANQLQREVAMQMRRIREKYKVSTPQGSLFTNMISFWDTSCLLTNLPQVSGSGVENLVAQIHRTHPATGFSAVYKSILTDLTHIQMLGTFYEQITRNVRYEQDAEYYSMRLQDPAYKKAHSWWSRPM